MEQRIRELEQVIGQRDCEISELRAEIARRDNLLETMGVHMPEDEPMTWKYKHVRGAWRRVSSDGWLLCPRCNTVFTRIVGTLYKYCPECAKRMTMRKETSREG